MITAIAACSSARSSGESWAARSAGDLLLVEDIEVFLGTRLALATLLKSPG